MKWERNPDFRMVRGKHEPLRSKDKRYTILPVLVYRAFDGDNYLDEYDTLAEAKKFTEARFEKFKGDHQC